MNKLRIYVAGPISKGDLRHNIQQARDASVALMKAGFAPFCPHLTCYMAGDTPEVLPCNTVHEDWYGIDLPWVAVCDGLLRLPGESTGADLEVQCAGQNAIPVYHSVDELLANPPKDCYGERILSDLKRGGDPRFHAILEEMAALHDKKSHDYGAGVDPYANVRASQEFGIAPWVGALVRENDKTTRIKSFLAKGNLANESLEDSLIDKCVYSVIALLLYREAK